MFSCFMCFPWERPYCTAPPCALRPCTRKMEVKLLHRLRRLCQACVKPGMKSLYCKSLQTEINMPKIPFSAAGQSDKKPRAAHDMVSMPSLQKGFRLKSCQGQALYSSLRTRFSTLVKVTAYLVALSTLMVNLQYRSADHPGNAPLDSSVIGKLQLQLGNIFFLWHTGQTACRMPEASSDWSASAVFSWFSFTFAVNIPL